MKLYIMRHAHGEEGDRMDASRQLTDYGKWQSDVMQKFLKQIDVKVDLVITSDFARGVGTGDYFRPKKARHVELKELRPVVPAEDAWTAILKVIKPEDQHVLIVGHGPQIKELVAATCFALDPFEKVLAHGNMVKIQSSEEHQFHWMMTPRLAAHMLGIEEDEDPSAVLTHQGKDPETAAIDEADLVTAAQEFAAACGISLKESLDSPSKRAIVDPLIAKVKKALRVRWAWQLKRLEERGLPLLQEALLHVQTLAPRGIRAPEHDKTQALATLPLHHGGFAKKFKQATKDAYAHGAARAEGQLPTPIEEAQIIKDLKARRAQLEKELIGFNLSEAPRKPLPGYSHDPEDVEDELDETTTRRVSTIVDKAFSSPLTYAAMVGLVREEFRGWSVAEEGETSRAETVALHEVSTAYHDGGRDFVDDWRGGNGPVEKRWNAEDDACEICLENESEEFIDSEAPHSSGDDEPPAHPNCRCEEEYRVAAVEEAIQ